MGQDAQNGKFGGVVALFSLEACSSCFGYHSALKATATIDPRRRKPKKHTLLGNKVTLFMLLRCKSNARGQLPTLKPEKTYWMGKLKLQSAPLRPSS